jgi:YD repeat-containing protein
MRATRIRLAYVAGVYALIYLLLFVVALLVSRLVSHPIHRIVHAVDRISHGDLEHRIGVETRSEVALLVSSINRTNFLPASSESFVHDLDGNLTSDGRWNYTWDGENRLIEMVARTAVGPQQRLDFGMIGKAVEYEGLGQHRRAQAIHRRISDFSTMGGISSPSSILNPPSSSPSCGV